MVKVMVLYHKPEDPEAFEKRYIEGHLPLVQKYPNVKDTTFSKVTRSLMGDSVYSYIYIGTWADKDSMKADMNSEEARVATDDAKQFAPKFDVFIVEDIA